MRLTPLRAIPLAMALLLGAACSSFLPEVGPVRGSTPEAGPGSTDAGSDGPSEARADSQASTDAAPSTFTVVVAPNGDHVFSPRDLAIHVGDTVHWVWEGSGHTVTSGMGGNADGTFCSPSGTACGGASTSATGATYDHTFMSAGTFPYFCRPHRSSGMTGSISVQ